MGTRAATRLVALALALGMLAGGCGDSADAPSRELSSQKPAAPSAPDAAPDADPGDADVPPGPVHLAGPTRELAEERGRAVGPPPEPPAAKVDGGVARKGYAVRFNSRVFELLAESSRTVGIFRRGTWLPVGEHVVGPDCPDGSWYALASRRGYVCTSDGVDVSEELPEDGPTSRRPDLEGALPYRYAKVETESAPRLSRLPRGREHERIELARESGQAWPEVVERRMRGDYLVALDERFPTEDGVLWRTVRGSYVYEKDLKPKPLPPMVGEPLDGAQDLPVAFVLEDDTPVYRVEPGGLSLAGRADKHARVRVAARIEEGGKRLVSTGELALERSAVRVADAIERPERIPAGEKWIHVDLAEQTLVAYEPDGPVFATLVSSGKPGYATPRGTFRVRKKYLTHTMSGRDPVDGVYEVGEVPWVMYYFKSYALHGAYWHDGFGQTRSHGCTNIAPADAKWLFYWSDPELPPRWHGMLRTAGTHVHFTR